MAVTWAVNTYRTTYKSSPNGMLGYIHTNVLADGLETQEEVRKCLSHHSVLSHYFVIGAEEDGMVVEQLRADFWLLKYPEGEREVGHG